MSKSMQYYEYPESTELNMSYSYNQYNDDDDDDDTCDICERSTVQYNCNKCANSICGEAECCLIFPHYCNTTYFVCSKCVDEISQNLILQIDLGKLVLLKEKIRTGTTTNSACSSRTNSACSSISSKLDDSSFTPFLTKTAQL